MKNLIEDAKKEREELNKQYEHAQTRAQARTYKV